LFIEISDASNHNNETFLENDDNMSIFGVAAFLHFSSLKLSFFVDGPR